MGFGQAAPSVVRGQPVVKAHRALCSPWQDCASSLPRSSPHPPGLGDTEPSTQEEKWSGGKASSVDESVEVKHGSERRGEEAAVGGARHR